MWKYSKQLGVGILFLFATHVLGDNTKSGHAKILIHPLNNGEMAFESALKFLGNKNIIRLDSMDYTAVPTVISDSITAFTRDVISGRPAWKVVINNVAINARAYESIMHPNYIMNFGFEVILDSLTGNCLMIRAIGRKRPDHERCDIDSSLPFQLMDIEYRKLPSQYPSIGFGGLLGRKEVLGDVAYETIGIYISGINKDINRRDKNENPIWVLTLNGLSPCESGKSFEYTNSRVVINDNDGRCLKCSYLGDPPLTDSSFNPIPK